MSDTLKPCGTCGGAPVLKRESANDVTKPRKMLYRYECPRCGTRAHWNANTAKAAICEWDNRQRGPEIMAKKSFKEDPALAFLTTPEEQKEKEPTAVAQDQTGETKPATTEISVQRTTSYRDMIKQVEARSKRLQCVIQPSLYNRAKATADERGVSMNELIHSIIEEYLEREGK
jgi:endogenous inhibitor of DNA gyrase (YacG/DUF329 family)